MASLHDKLGIGYLIHPIPLTAVVILALNDHVLKRCYPSILTGKLSDFSGVFLFPILLCALINLLSNLYDAVTELGHAVPRSKFRWISERQGVAAIAVTDAVFISVKLVPAVAELYIRFCAGIGFPSRVTRDPSDLIALTINFASWIYIRRQAQCHPLREPQSPK